MYGGLSFLKKTNRDKIKNFVGLYHPAISTTNSTALFVAPSPLSFPLKSLRTTCIRLKKYAEGRFHHIKYGEALLKDPEKNEESISATAYLSGFQSKSSFNKAFKSLIGMTPSEYRKTH